jgi:enoyl-CoA hydratase/carnithine racemase
MSSNHFDHRSQDLLFEQHDDILVLTINRQDSYNSWTSALRDELARQLLQANAAPAVRAIVLTGGQTEVNAGLPSVFGTAVSRQRPAKRHRRSRSVRR